MAQCDTKRVNVKSVIGHPVFLQGFHDAMNGIGFYERYETLPTNQQWSYERGRQFYFAAGKKRIKQGRGVSREAIKMFVELRTDNSIL